MEGIKKIKMLETGEGKEDNMYLQLLSRRISTGKEYHIISTVLYFIFAYEKFVENENSLWMNTVRQNFVECCGLGVEIIRITLINFTYLQYT